MLQVKVARPAPGIAQPGHRSADQSGPQPRPASHLAQPPGLDGLGVGDPLLGGVGDVLVDGDGVARAVADLEGLGVTVGDGLAVGVALRVLDADDDGCGRVD
jgi:hypothetical protein